MCLRGWGPRDSHFITHHIGIHRCGSIMARLGNSGYEPYYRYWSIHGKLIQGGTFFDNWRFQRPDKGYKTRIIFFGPSCDCYNGGSYHSARETSWTTRSCTGTGIVGPRRNWIFGSRHMTNDQLLVRHGTENRTARHIRDLRRADWARCLPPKQQFNCNPAFLQPRGLYLQTLSCSRTHLLNLLHPTYKLLNGKKKGNVTISQWGK